MEQNGINNLASSILDFTTGIAKSKVDGAQYDKSFNTVIWGINQLFTDDVPQSVQERLIKEHDIPEISENYFYTFVIDGNYYVKESDAKFKLYQNVVVRVPNGNWDKMYIESINMEGDDLTAGIGVEIKDGKINLKPAQMGRYFDNDWNGWKDYRGGIFIDKALWGSADGLWVSDNGALKLLPADCGVSKNGRIEGATGYGGVSIGKGIATTDKGHISVNLGSGMRFNQPPEGEPQYESNWSISPKLGDGLAFDGEDNAIHLNLGNGLEFGARKYEKDEDGNDDPTRYTSEVRVKLGEGMRFGAGGELIASAAAYKAGENIAISEDGTISAQVKEYKAGKNITISDDGTISAEGTGGAELIPGGGITIETDEETGNRTVSAAVGEGAEIRDGKICTVPNIQNAVMISEKDAKYLLHSFTEIEYNSGSQIGYAGPGNQIILQGQIVYKSGSPAPNGLIVSNGVDSKDSNDIPNTPKYMTLEFGGGYYSGDSSNQRAWIKKLVAKAVEFNISNTVWHLIGTKEDDTEVVLYVFSTAANWSGSILSIVYQSIYAPGSVYGGRTFEFGFVECKLYKTYKQSNDYYSYGENYRTTLYIPFKSLAEYQAAVGLTYEPLTLTRVEDNPTVVGGREVEEGDF